MTGFLKQFPVFSVGFLPDFIDEDGIPLLEPDSHTYGWHLSKIPYVPCSLNDARSELNLPMNVRTLKVLMADPALWVRGISRLSTRLDMTGWTPLARMRASSDLFTCLAYICEARHGQPLSRRVANLFKFFRGIAHYSRDHLTIGPTEPGLQGQTMFEYSLARGFLASPTGVCPASRTLMNRIEAEMAQLTVEPAPPCWDVDDGYGLTDLLDARLLGALFDLFGVLCAIQFMTLRHRSKITREPSDLSLAKPFPLPNVTWLAERTDGEVPVEYFAGLRATMTTLQRVDPETSQVEDLLDRCEDEESNVDALMAESIQVGCSLNRKAAQLLGLPAVPDLETFSHWITRLVRSRVLAAE